MEKVRKSIAPTRRFSESMRAEVVGQPTSLESKGKRHLQGHETGAPACLKRHRCHAGQKEEFGCFHNLLKAKRESVRAQKPRESLHLFTSPQTMPGAHRERLRARREAGDASLLLGTWRERAVTLEKALSPSWISPLIFPENTL